VNALNAAAAYEAIYFYNAYKMEYATVSDPALRTIAKGCVHNGLRAGIPATSGPGIVEANFIQSTIDAKVEGICSFDDFLKEIQSHGWSAYKRDKPSPANPTSQSVTLEPDADAVSARINDPATIGRNRLQFNAKTLLSPSVLDTIVEHAPNGDEVHPYGKVISKISDAVQTARVAHANGIGPAAFQGVCQTHLLKILYVSLSAQALRSVPGVGNKKFYTLSCCYRYEILPISSHFP
jgi:hypothetical protein